MFLGGRGNGLGLLELRDRNRVSNVVCNKLILLKFNLYDFKASLRSLTPTLKDRSQSQLVPNRLGARINGISHPNGRDGWRVW